MNLPKKCIATSAAVFAALLLCSAAVFAEPSIARVSQIEGHLLVKKINGDILVVSTDSAIDVGDTLVSETKTYANIRFIDNSEVILKPNTQLTIEAFAFDAKQKSKQGALFSLSKGGVQIHAGLTAQKTSEGLRLLAPNLSDPLASITADRNQATVFYAEYGAEPEPAALAFSYHYTHTPILLAMNESDTRSDAPLLFALTTPPSPPTPSGLAPGLYVQVIDGAINLSNKGGTQNFSAGQFGYTASFIQPPVVVPKNPGLQFTPPPAFSSSSPSNSGNTSNKPKSVDCEVR